MKKNETDKMAQNIFTSSSNKRLIYRIYETPKTSITK
jgi:hypothetical protein